MPIRVADQMEFPVIDSDNPEVLSGGPINITIEQRSQSQSQNVSVVHHILCQSRTNKPGLVPIVGLFALPQSNPRDDCIHRIDLSEMASRPRNVRNGDL